MARKTKTNKLEIYATILEVIRLGTDRITRISYGVGVPLDRLNIMANDLCSFGLARKMADDEGTRYSITPRGTEFLDTYWKMRGFLEIMGGYGDGGY
jgi:predicted transcriptional regulator